MNEVIGIKTRLIRLWSLREAANLDRTLPINNTVPSPTVQPGLNVRERCLLNILYSYTPQPFINLKQYSVEYIIYCYGQAWLALIENDTSNGRMGWNFESPHISPPLPPCWDGMQSRWFHSNVFSHCHGTQTEIVEVSYRDAWGMRGGEAAPFALYTARGSQAARPAPPNFG